MQTTTGGGASGGSAARAEDEDDAARRSTISAGAERGAVAPTVALSLFALIAVGGIAFDYARLACLDTELQDAADQAALAAASQLDQTRAARCERATAAAQSLLTNRTLMANDANAQRHGRHHSDRRSSIRPRPTPRTTRTASPTRHQLRRRQFRPRRRGRAPGALCADPDRRRVHVGRHFGAEAVAGLGSAICKVPPVMICNPAEPDSNTNVELAFNRQCSAGHGLRLISVGNGNTAWAPGNFGYLDTGSSTSNPNVELRQALGWTTAPGDCSGLRRRETRTGAGTPVTQALNTRFDIYDKPNTGNGNSASCPTGSSCPPSINTVKDVLRKGNAGNGSKCGFANNEWELPTKQLPSNICGRPRSHATRPTYPDAMGYPRDECHAISINGSCTYNSITPAKIGNGTWDRNAYFQVELRLDAARHWPNIHQQRRKARSRPALRRRYQVYLWEIANRGTTIGGEDHPWRSPGRRYPAQHAGFPSPAGMFAAAVYRQ